MSDPKLQLIEALRHALEGKDGLIEALTAKADAYKDLAEARKGQIEGLKADLAEREPAEELQERIDKAIIWLVAIRRGQPAYSMEENAKLALKCLRPEG